MLLLAASTSGGTWDSLLHAEVVESSAEAPKKLQEHLGKCKEALATKVAVELVAFQNKTSKGEKV